MPTVIQISLKLAFNVQIEGLRAFAYAHLNAVLILGCRSRNNYALPHLKFIKGYSQLEYIN